MDKLKRFCVLSGEDKETEWSTLLWFCCYIHHIHKDCGKEAFCPYFADMMTQDFNGIKTGIARLKPAVECNANREGDCVREQGFYQIKINVIRGGGAEET